MEDIPNVNRLNGIPNFGHGFPEDVPLENVQTDAASPDGVVVEDVSSEVDITNQEAQ